MLAALSRPTIARQFAAVAVVLALAAGASALQVPASGASALSSMARLPSGTAKVEVVLIAEALCPYCAAFTVHTLAPLMEEQGFGQAISFRYVAWGNAVNSSSGGVRCQHGAAECALNRVINCAAHLAPEQDCWLPFVVCLERAPAERIETAVDKCAEEAGIDAGEIHKCAEGPLGDRLERAAEEETAALHPPHTYVPWVLVEGIPLGDSYDQLKKFVCVALGADHRPEACYDPPDADAFAVAGASLRLPRALPSTGGGAVDARGVDDTTGGGSSSKGGKREKKRSVGTAADTA